MQPCEAESLLRQAVEAMRPSAEEQQLQLFLTAQPIQIWAHSDSIVQTLTNLLSNAIKFSSPGKTIHLSVEIDAPDARCPHPGFDGINDTNSSNAANLAEFARFTVRDHGRGIPPELLEKVFEQFQQVDASDSRLKGGTGLGLAICRKIVEQHGGKIWVESVLGEGSIFRFTVPLHRASSPVASRIGAVRMQL